MSQFTEKTTKTIQFFEDALFKIVSKPTIDIESEVLSKSIEVKHKLSLKIMNMENADLLDLQMAFAIEHENVEEALATLEEATKANTDYLTLLHSADYALQIMNNFFLLLL